MHNQLINQVAHPMNPILTDGKQMIAQQHKMNSGNQNHLVQNVLVNVKHHTPNPASTPPRAQQSKECNSTSLFRIGQTTVQDIMSRTQEVFRTLKAIQPPNGTPQGNIASNEMKAKVEELLRTIRILFKRLRLIYEKCNENRSDVQIERLIPFKDCVDPKHDKKKNSESFRMICEESQDVMGQVVLKNRQLKEVIDHLTRILWEINTMLTMARS